MSAVIMECCGHPAAAHWATKTDYGCNDCSPNPCPAGQDEADPERDERIPANDSTQEAKT
jgi:hypothetical protein